jgi:hypothetical protein
MFIDFRDIFGFGIIGMIIVGFFVLLGGLPISVIICLGILTYLAFKYAQ